MAAPEEILSHARVIQYSAPRLNTGAMLSPYLRDKCEVLATMCGVRPRQLRRANDNDLISIYLVALKDPKAACRVAERIELRLDDTLLPSPEPEPTPKWIEAIPLPPARLPTPRPDAPTVDLEAIRALIKREVKEGALAPLQALLNTQDEAMRADFAHLMTETATRTHTEVLDAMRDQLREEAHKAVVETLKSLTPTRLDVTLNGEPAPVSLGLVHRDTAKIINALSAGVNVYLYGPAGSGKTTVARKVAEAFKLQFYFAAKVESEYMLLGFKDAKGETVRTQFREAYEHGGVFLFDEMDASSPSAVVALNAALANGVCPFPDGIVARHASFVCLGAGNTKLTGANRQYAGRNQLDAASIDRFSFIEFDYDDELELALAADHSWAKYVQRVRAIVAERGLNHLVTPRATYDGCKLLAAGFDRDTVAQMVVYKGLDASTVKQIEQAL